MLYLPMLRVFLGNDKTMFSAGFGSLYNTNIRRIEIELFFGHHSLLLRHSRHRRFIFVGGRRHHNLVEYYHYYPCGGVFVVSCIRTGA
jgi:hypothetical protein